MGFLVSLIIHGFKLHGYFWLGITYLVFIWIPFVYFCTLLMTYIQGLLFTKRKSFVVNIVFNVILILIIEVIILLVFNKICGYAYPNEEDIQIMSGIIGISLMNTYLFFAYEKQ